jgi:hypothetical protein
MNECNLLNPQHTIKCCNASIWVDNFNFSEYDGKYIKILYYKIVIKNARFPEKEPCGKAESEKE